MYVSLSVICLVLMQKVFSEAEEMAKRYREQLPVISQNLILDDGLPGEMLPFDDEAKLYANWKWFKFLHHTGSGSNFCIITYLVITTTTTTTMEIYHSFEGIMDYVEEYGTWVAKQISGKR
jgi:hypothetical protein